VEEEDAGEEHGGCWRRRRWPVSISVLDQVQAKPLPSAHFLLVAARCPPSLHLEAAPPRFGCRLVRCPA